MLVKICDAPMGAGKTSAAINYMNQHWEKNFLFVTPYLSEVERVCSACAEREFVAPENKGKGKLEDLIHQVMLRNCIASTHALLSTYNNAAASVIKDAGYTLILDEVANVLDIVEISKADVLGILNNWATYDKDTGRVIWLDDTYSGKFNNIKRMAQSNRLIFFNNAFLFWEFPVDVFEAFDEVIILTYMYECQIQAYYFKAHGIEMQPTYIDNSTGSYLFTENEVKYSFMQNFVKKINVCDHAKLNMIGDKKGSLSKSWYTRVKKSISLKRLKDNMYNYFYNICKAKSNDVLWTTFKDYSRSTSPRSYSKGYLPCTMRASNSYRDRNCLAYCVNIFINPVISQYFYSKGIVVDQDRYALSTLVQWIWRSAIRDGKDINIYLPSKRMRTLLLNWIAEVSQ